MLTLDYSRTKTNHECQRKDYYKNVLNLGSSYGSTKLRFGSVIHAILDGYYAHSIGAGIHLGKASWEEESKGRSFSLDYRTYDLARKCISAYLKHWSGVKLTDVSSEQYLETIIEPTAEEKLLFPLVEKVKVNGMVDLSGKLNGSLVIMDHKSTGMYVPQAEKIYRDSIQFMVYAFLYNEIYKKMPVYCVTNVIHASRRAIKIGGPSDKPDKGNTLIEDEKSGESILYGAVKFEFARFPTMVTPAKLRAVREYLLATAQRVRQAEESGFWMQQWTSCMDQYQSLCPYHRLCDQYRPLDKVNISGYNADKWDPEKVCKKQKEILDKYIKENN